MISELQFPCIFFFFFCYLENLISSAQLKDIWKVKGIMDESNTYEHNYVELSDNEEEEPTKAVLSSYSDNSEKEDEELGDSDDSEVCGAASNKFSVLDVSD